VLFVVTFIPDVVLLATGFLPGATPGAVIALMLMHPVVAGAAVLVGQRIAPAR
jgi:mannitol-specific phosphotransferase system IIBC component